MSGGGSDLRRISRAREEFLSGSGVGDEVPERLSAAWRRSLFLGARPERSSVLVAEIPEPSPLVTAANPVVNRLLESLGDTQVSVVLTDNQARVLSCWSVDNRARKHLENINTRPGADLSEHSAGNNGISEVLWSRRAEVVEGPEHILGLYQRTRCAGAPLHDPVRNRIAGALSLVCELDSPRHLLTGLTTMVATAIEDEMLRRARPLERVMADAYTRASADGKPVLVLDGHTRIVSPAAAAVVSEREIEILEADAAEARHRADAIVHNVLLEEAGLVAVVHPLWWEDRMQAAIVELRQGETAPRTTRRPQPRRWAELVGSSPRWTRMSQVAAGLRADRPALVIGEPGVGKYVVGRALVGDSTSVRVLDGRSVCSHREQEWLRTLEDCVAQQHSTVMLTHVDSLPDSTARAVLAMVGPTQARLVATASDLAEQGPPSVRMLVEHFAAQRLAVPPLRDRTGDIPELVQFHARKIGRRPLSLTIEAQHALSNYRWPGNVAELVRVVDALVGLNRGRPVSLAELPDEISRCSRGRTLSGIESAEYTAIRDALRQHDGNRLRAAKTLGIARATLYRKLKQYGLDTMNPVG